MAKVGYIFKAGDYAEYEADKAWMQQYGCVQVVEEPERNEETRPHWKQLLTTPLSREITRRGNLSCPERI